MISWWNSSISHSSFRCPVLFFNHCVFTVSRCQFLHLILGMKHFGEWCVSRLFEKKEHKYQKGSKMQISKKHGKCTTSGLKEMRCFFAKVIVVDGSSHIAGYDMAWLVTRLGGLYYSILNPVLTCIDRLAELEEKKPPVLQTWIKENETSISKGELNSIFLLFFLFQDSSRHPYGFVYEAASGFPSKQGTHQLYELWLVLFGKRIKWINSLNAHNKQKKWYTLVYAGWWFPAKCRWFHLAWTFPLRNPGCFFSQMIPSPNISGT